MWILTLKNFSYHKEARFEINENAITLFSGESGSGKTTIFRALAYAFFGSRIRSIASFDKKSCTVTLEMNDKKIVRTSSPKSIKVYVYETSDKGQQEFCFENEAAEEYIVKKIVGQTYEQFLSGSYRNNVNSSVVSMPPAEQLRFIEKLAFSDIYRNELFTSIKLML